MGLPSPLPRFPVFVLGLCPCTPSIQASLSTFDWELGLPPPNKFLDPESRRLIIDSLTCFLFLLNNLFGKPCVQQNLCCNSIRARGRQG